MLYFFYFSYSQGTEWRGTARRGTARRGQARHGKVRRGEARQGIYLKNDKMLASMYFTGDQKTKRITS